MDFLNTFYLPLKQPENGIGWTPDRFRLAIWYPSGLWKDDEVGTWEQISEKARRLIEQAHDPVLSVTIAAVFPLREMEEREERSLQ